MNNNNGWIGVDLDGTLAHYDGWKGEDRIGDPIPIMMERVKTWLKEGIEVRIVTARAGVQEQIPFIKTWLKKHGIGEVGITNKKDFQMIQLWDDRAIQVITNTGKIK